MDNKGQPLQYAPPAQTSQPGYAMPPQQFQYAPQQQPMAAQVPVAPQPAYSQQPQQYVPPAPMQVAGGPNPEWQSSLLDCSPCDTCLLGTFLPCILIGQTTDRIRDPTMQTADAFNPDCMILCAINFFSGCGWLYIMIKRSEIRQRFGIKGDGFGDCCAAYWCPCCALIQQDKEVVVRTKSALMAQGYQAQPSMQMPQNK